MRVSGTAVSCAQCLSLLVTGLRKVAGIENVEADTGSDALIIDFDASVLDEDGIRTALRSIGFASRELYCIC